MLGDQADQRDQPDLGVDVERAEAEIERHDGAEDRQRHRHHDDQRVAEALELRRQHQVDHHDRRREGDQDRVALLLLEPGLAGIVDEEAVGQASAWRCPRWSASPSPVVTPGSGSAEIVAEFSWLNCSIAAGEALVEMVTTADSGTISPLRCARRTRRAAAGLFAVLLRHLRDDVVAVGIAVELGDRAAADQQRQACCRCRRSAGSAPRRGRGRWSPSPAARRRRASSGRR